MIIGPWLFRFISIVYERLRNIELARRNKILYVKIHNYSKKIMNLMILLIFIIMWNPINGTI